MTNKETTTILVIILLVIVFTNNQVSRKELLSPEGQVEGLKSPDFIYSYKVLEGKNDCEIVDAQIVSCVVDPDTPLIYEEPLVSGDFIFSPEERLPLSTTKTNTVSYTINGVPKTLGMTTGNTYELVPEILVNYDLQKTLSSPNNILSQPQDFKENFVFDLDIEKILSIETDSLNYQFSKPSKFPVRIKSSIEGIQGGFIYYLRSDTFLEGEYNGIIRTKLSNTYTTKEITIENNKLGSYQIKIIPFIVFSVGKQDHYLYSKTVYETDYTVTPVVVGTATINQVAFTSTEGVTIKSLSPTEIKLLVIILLLIISTLLIIKKR